jgi:hypothetical protein
MLITVRDQEQIGEEFIGVSPRITGFLYMEEFPAEDLEIYLKKAEDVEALVIGVHYSDERSLVISKDHDSVDIHSKFVMKEEPVIYTKVFTFKNLPNWDHQLNKWIQAFKKKFGVYPNIMLASSLTYSRIELVVNARSKEHLHNADGMNPSEGEFATMGGFRGVGYEVDFCMEESLAVDSVKLIYDSDPNGGLPLPEEEEVILESKKDIAS